MSCGEQPFQRSGVPGLRSGFVAGDKKFKKFQVQNISGRAMSLQVQLPASQLGQMRNMLLKIDATIEKIWL